MALELKKRVENLIPIEFSAILIDHGNPQKLKRNHTFPTKAHSFGETVKKKSFIKRIMSL